jgi:transposase
LDTPRKYPGPPTPPRRATLTSRRLSKKLPERVKEVREAHPKTRVVELWAEDEMRVGLKPVLRRVWAPWGKRPVAKVKRRYKWVYVYGFVRPTTGETYWLILPTVNVEMFSLALKHFAQGVGAGEEKHILLVVDQAGWHTGGEVEVPKGIELEFLPARSPELMPSERLWPLINERVANRLFEELNDLQEALVERCLSLSEQPESVQGHTLYHWWPDAA